MAAYQPFMINTRRAVICVPEYDEKNQKDQTASGSQRKLLSKIAEAHSRSKFQRILYWYVFTQLCRN
jgi:hypothetical protein